MDRLLLTLSFLLLIVLFSSSSCNKQQEPERYVYTTIHPMDEEMKGFFASFKEGSWWVYEEETTGELDTTVVEYNSRFVDAGPYGMDSIAYESFRVKYVPTKTWGFFTIIRTLKQKPDFFSFRIFYSSGGGGNSHLTWKEDGEFVVWQTSEGPNVIVLDSFEVSGKVYFDVLELADDVVNPKLAKVWYAKNIGIIKKISREGGFVRKTWNLIDHHIVN